MATQQSKRVKAETLDEAPPALSAEERAEQKAARRAATQALQEAARLRKEQRAQQQANTVSQQQANPVVSQQQQAKAVVSEQQLAAQEANRLKKEQRAQQQAILVQQQQEAKAARTAQRQQAAREILEVQTKEAIARSEREVVIRLDPTAIATQLKNFLGKFGEIESLAPVPPVASFVARFTDSASAKKALTTHGDLVPGTPAPKNAPKRLQVNAPLLVEQQEIRAFALHFVPAGDLAEVDDKYLAEAAALFNKVAPVKLIAKRRHAVVAVFENTASRDRVLAANTGPWQVRGAPLQLLAGSPPRLAASLRKRKQQPASEISA